MSDEFTRTGLRLLELEAGLAENVVPESVELVDYEATRVHGRAARLAMLVRGQDIIEDVRRLRMLAAAELKISGADFDAAVRALQEVDLLEARTTRLGKSVFFEKVERLDYSANYERIGGLWRALRDKSHKEEALIETLDEVVVAPKALLDIAPLQSLNSDDRKLVIEVGSNACVLDSLEKGANPVLFTPLLWDVDREKLRRFLVTCERSEFSRVLDLVRGRPGVELSDAEDPLVAQAIRGGILPSYRVDSAGGVRVYSFAPYSGDLLTTPEEKTVLQKAQSIVSCLRYGSEAAVITRIRNPLAILSALTDSSRKHRIRPHTELKNQYGMLVQKGVGRVLKTAGSRYSFELIPTKDNLRACEIAKEFFRTGEILEEKDPSAQTALHLVSGSVAHPIREVHVAKKRRGATTDELAGLVEQIRI